MKKIKDERLILQNLKNIRILYAVQTFGVICILAYDFMTKGLDGMTDNPLWGLFILTAVISSYLSMSISIDYENQYINPKKRLILSLVVLTFISVSIGIATLYIDDFKVIDSVIVGSVLFICGLIPIIYVYYLRKARQDEI